MKAEGNYAGQKQRNPSHDQATSKHYRSLLFIVHGTDDNR
jgi:hypothetical protein